MNMIFLQDFFLKVLNYVYSLLISHKLAGPLTFRLEIVNVIGLGNFNFQSLSASYHASPLVRREAAIKSEAVNF